MTTTLLHGDCREVLRSLPDCSVDSVVTDPPYELGFMGKAWDASGVAYDVDLWREVLRVLKPGGHLCAFGGTRTYHRMACAIEDAGFEIRDSLQWVYGSGFPKSLDVSKAIDKQRDDRADIYRVTAWVREVRDAASISNRDIDAAFDANGMGRHWTDVPPHGKQPAVPTLEQVPLLLDTLGVEFDDVPEEIRRLLWDLNGRKGQPGDNWWKREVVGERKQRANSQESKIPMNASTGETELVTTAATDAAKQWEGWGTALKPAHEIIVLARKPLIGTVAANVLTHGTGALNIDDTRVGYASEADKQRMSAGVDSIRERGGVVEGSWKNSSDLSGANPASERGRWPANVIFDTEAGALLDEQSGESKSGTAVRRNVGKSGGNFPFGAANPDIKEDVTYGDTGGASRFFTSIDWEPEIDVPFRYVPKPSKRERTCDGTVSGIHPTVKPLALMRWLVRLVTPPGGTVLEPFAGSGTTLMAATLEGFDSIGIELTEEYLPIIRGRVAWAEQQAQQTTDPTAHVQETLPL